MLMELYSVYGLDYAYGQWFWATSVWARSAADAISRASLGKAWKSYRAEVSACGPSRTKMAKAGAFTSLEVGVAV